MYVIHWQGRKGKLESLHTDCNRKGCWSRCHLHAFQEKDLSSWYEGGYCLDHIEEMGAGCFIYNIRTGLWEHEGRLAV